MMTLFQSTHPVWGATPGYWIISELDTISIHAPRVGCDNSGIARHRRLCYFNPRTPCGVRPGLIQKVSILLEFQSTHPVWGATIAPITKT